MSDAKASDSSSASESVSVPSELTAEEIERPREEEAGARWRGSE